jgi:hypothetical protein
VKAKSSFSAVVWNDFAGVIDKGRVRLDKDEFIAFQNRPDVRHIVFERDTDWGEVHMGEVTKRSGTWRYRSSWGQKKYSVDTREPTISLDLITYLHRSIVWFSHLPVLFKVERNADGLQSNAYFVVLSREHFKRELFTRIVGDFKKAEPHSEIRYYNSSNEALAISGFDTRELKTVTRPDRLSFHYAEFQVDSAAPVSSRNYYRLCALLNNVGWNDYRGEFQRYCDTYPDNLFSIQS